MLNKNKVTIYTAWYCSFCDDAKKYWTTTKLTTLKSQQARIMKRGKKW